MTDDTRPFVVLESTSQGLEAAYRRAWFGAADHASGPDYMVVFCQECRMTFELKRGGENCLCAHLRNAIDEATRQRDKNFMDGSKG